MKKVISISTFAIILMVAVSSCKNDDNSLSTSTPILNSNIQQGNWKVTLFKEDGNDETIHFTGYEFQFNSNGTVTATKNGSTASGTWNNGNDDSAVKLALNFSVNPFIELTDDWHVTQQNSSAIILEDISGGNGGTDYLTFEKI